MSRIYYCVKNRDDSKDQLHHLPENLAKPASQKLKGWTTFSGLFLMI